MNDFNREFLRENGGQDVSFLNDSVPSYLAQRKLQAALLPLIPNPEDEVSFVLFAAGIAGTISFSIDRVTWALLDAPYELEAQDALQSIVQLDLGIDYYCKYVCPKMPEEGLES